MGWRIWGFVQRSWKGWVFRLFILLRGNCIWSLIVLILFGWVLIALRRGSFVLRICLHWLNFVLLLRIKRSTMDIGLKLWSNFIELHTSSISWCKIGGVRYCSAPFVYVLMSDLTVWMFIFVAQDDFLENVTIFHHVNVKCFWNQGLDCLESNWGNGLS